MRYLIALLFSAQAQAYSLPTGEEIALTVEPIYGYEWVHKEKPTPHVHGRVFYGVRAYTTYRNISIEGEYTQADDREVFVSGYSTREFVEKAKLGLRRHFPIGTGFAAYARAGGQASKSHFEEWRFTSRTSSHTGSWMYRPYIGGGGNISVYERLSIMLDGTVVIHDVKNLNKNEYQGSIGFSGRVF